MTKTKRQPPTCPRCSGQDVRPRRARELGYKCKAKGCGCNFLWVTAPVSHKARDRVQVAVVLLVWVLLVLGSGWILTHISKFIS